MPSLIIICIILVVAVTVYVYKNFVSQEESLKYQNDNLRKGEDSKDQTIKQQQKRISDLQKKCDFYESTKSNLTAIPYMAEIIADYETHHLEDVAKGVESGYTKKDIDKATSIREIKKETKETIERYQEDHYKLCYIEKLFPDVVDILETDYYKLPNTTNSPLTQSDYDCVRDYISKEEYSQLSTAQRNQLALDRYKQSHNKSKWQIGRDYEMYIGYQYSLKGYSVDYYGSEMRLEDLGRDLIVKKNGQVLIIQCKYWSTSKEIHENHINQLYGTTIAYSIEYGIKSENVKGVLVTNTALSDMAKKVASYLGIEYVEHKEIGPYPCIKCNIRRGDYGIVEKIYHLPFDQQYDNTKIKNKGEFFAMTVNEAESAGFRRAGKWLGTNT